VTFGAAEIGYGPVGKDISLMSSPPDRELARRLLSGRRGPSRVQKELMLERTLAAVVPGKTRWPRWRITSLVASAGLAAAMFALWPTASQWTARGAAATPVLRLRCGASLDGCRAGDRLRFELVGEPPARYVAILARRDDGTMLWYVPDAAGRSADLEHDVVDRVLDRQVVLGGDHPRGRYEVIAVFSSRALDRNEIRAALADDGAAGVTVRRQTMELR
jgi:hypothetical protein